MLSDSPSTLISKDIKSKDRHYKRDSNMRIRSSHLPNLRESTKNNIEVVICKYTVKNIRSMI